MSVLVNADNGRGRSYKHSKEEIGLFPWLLVAERKEDSARVALRFRSLLPAAGAVFAAVIIAFAAVGHHNVGASSVTESDRSLLDAIAQRVEDVYYKPVDTRQLVKGEYDGIVQVLKDHHQRANLVPLEHGTGDADHDDSLMDHVLDTSILGYQNHVQPIDITQGAIKGMLAVLGDPYTVYLTPAEIASLEESLKGGDFSGIGVYIIQDPRNGEILVDPIDDTPAAKAGMRPGDSIVAVDGHKVRGMKLDLVERLIRGKEGSIVTLSVKPRHDAASRTVKITRETIHVPSVKAKIEDNIDYIRLADFGDTSAAEIKKAIQNGKQHNVHGYILDLRNNGGGLLDAAVDISSLFIPQGPIVSTIDRSGAKDTKSALGTSMNPRPLVVLINRYTASASEITAGAIQDDHVGILIGTKSFGKGVVQSIYHLDPDGALKVTTARYVTPAGRDIHHKGIRPDRVIDMNDDLRILDTNRDTQLNAAKAYIQRWARH
jgi:carboxyl-terminal processing protease